jgi:hypothetical protein
MIAVRLSEIPAGLPPKDIGRPDTQHSANTIAACFLSKLHVPSTHCPVLWRRHNADLYLSGHDQDLQHLEFKGHPTSFVISGGGGAELVGWTPPPQS